MAEIYNNCYLNRNTNYGNYGLINLGMYNFGGGFGYTNQYIHFKTNLTLYTNIMTRMEAVGYNYGSALPIKCCWVSYTYSYLISGVVTTSGTGLTAHGTYMSTDGYVVYRAFCSNDYFINFTLNSMHVNPTGYGFNLAITAVNKNTNSGNYY